MKRTKKNNKGFSLVELIVVVLIMAIIAVALAPQVMKWVGNSRTATDVQTYDAFVSNCQTALADETAWEDCKGVSFTITLTKDAVPKFSGTTPDSFKTALKAIASDYDTVKLKEDETYTITVNKGNVERTTAPDGSSVGASATTAP